MTDNTMTDEQIVAELDRLRRELRWLDADTNNRWWEQSTARRLVCEQIVELTRARLALLDAGEA